MKKNKIKKIINNALIVTHVLNFTPALAMDSEMDLLDTDLNMESNIKSDVPIENIENVDIEIDSEDVIKDFEDDVFVSNDTTEEFVVEDESLIEDINNDLNANIDISQEAIIDECINNNKKEIENAEVLSEKAVVEDNWVNRAVAESLYYNQNKYTQITEDDYLKVTYISTNNISSGNVNCPDLLKLVNLTTLSLGGDGLSGEIPEFIGELNNLESLYINAENLTGSIPESIGNLTNLKYLTISDTKNLTGPIPESIGNLTNLSSFSISGNESLTGPIPNSIGNLTNLSSFSVNNNKNLTGSIPESIGNLTQLSTLTLSQNNLTGSIPDSIGDLINLKYIFLQDNQLTGSIPKSIGNLSNLCVLNISRNSLSGEIPENIGNLICLENLYLTENELSGEIPESIGELKQLTYLELHTNNLTGNIPESIGELVKLESLALFNNNLTGEIPEAIGNMISLMNLYLYNNRLGGYIPDVLDNMSKLSNVYLYNNQLVGTVSSKLLSLGSVYYFAENFFTNGVNQSQLTFDNSEEIIIDINKPLDIELIKSKLNVVKGGNIEKLHYNYDIKISSDNESVLTNDFKAIGLGETEITVSLNIGADANTYTTTNNKLKVKVTDLSAPELNLEQSTTDWVNSSVTIKGKASDNYILDKVVLPDGSNVKDVEFEYTVTTNGNYIFEAYDSTGNKSTETITINNIDVEKPIINIEKVLKEDNTVDISIKVDDNLSGVKNVTVNGLVLKKSNNSVVNIDRNGLYNIVAIDNAGNESFLEFEITEIKAIVVDDETANKPDTKPNIDGDKDNSTNNSDKDNSLNNMPKTGGISGAINTICLCLLAIGSSMAFKKKNRQ